MIYKRVLSWVSRLAVRPAFFFFLAFVNVSILKELHYAQLCLRLNEIQEIYNSVKDQIGLHHLLLRTTVLPRKKRLNKTYTTEKIKWTQKQLTIPPDPNSFENLNKQQKDLLAALQWGVKVDLNVR